MAGQDAELEQFRAGVNCAALLERLPPPWRLDSRESTRRALKYRRGEGEVLIVNHDGRGWWDPRSSAKGDIFTLVQFLDPSLNFGQVRQVLRRHVGVVPTFPETLRRDTGPAESRSINERWRTRPLLRVGSPPWRYLAGERALPARTLIAARDADAVRQGPYGSPWFAHRDDAGGVTHIEIRGLEIKSSVRGGRKTLFRLPGSGRQPTRLAITEAPIDALSLAAVEQIREDTLYVATGGGMGPGTIEAIERALAVIASTPVAVFASATDANATGEHYAERHAQLARSAGVAFERLRPPVGLDWNDTIKQRRTA